MVVAPRCIKVYRGTLGITQVRENRLDMSHTSINIEVAIIVHTISDFCSSSFDSLVKACIRVSVGHDLFYIADTTGDPDSSGRAAIPFILVLYNLFGEKVQRILFS
jgi:hypothetical protein